MATLTLNVGLDDVATSTQTSTVGEPSVAMSGQRIMITGNWYASRSTNFGASWTFINPFTEFPNTSGDFCCDQLVYYSKRSRIWIWLLQYSQQGPSNIVRIATSRTGAPGSWAWFDIRPVDVDPTWGQFWFDYPDLAESDGHLYITTNVFDSSDNWVAAAVVRYPMAEIVAGGALTRRTFTTTQFGSLRLVQGADDTMWFASHPGNNRSLRVFSWPDSATSVNAWTVSIGQWNEGQYSSKGPGAAEWLGRLDGRITGGFRANGLLGFAWSATPRPGRPNPYVARRAYHRGHDASVGRTRSVERDRRVGIPGSGPESQRCNRYDRVLWWTDSPRARRWLVQQHHRHVGDDNHRHEHPRSGRRQVG